jgi:hypothetical protein
VGSFSKQAQFRAWLLGRCDPPWGGRFYGHKTRASCSIVGFSRTVSKAWLDGGDVHRLKPLRNWMEPLNLYQVEVALYCCMKSAYTGTDMLYSGSFWNFLVARGALKECYIRDKYRSEFWGGPFPQDALNCSLKHPSDSNYQLTRLWVSLPRNLIQDNILSELTRRWTMRHVDSEHSTGSLKALHFWPK